MRKALIALLLVALVAPAFAQYTPVKREDTQPTLTVTTMTVGDVVTDDITASGADSASVDINIPASTNAQQGTITVKSAATVANMDDGDYVEYNLMQAYDSATAACDYVYMRAVADDVTTDTQDGALEVYVEVNSTATKMLDVDASGLTVGGGVVATSVAGAAATTEVLSMGYAAVATDTTATDGGTYIVDSSGAEVTLVLPDANTVLGETVRVMVKVAGNNAVINTDGTDVYIGGDGGASDNSAVLDAAFDALWLQATGSNEWAVLNQTSVSSWTTQ